MSRKHALKQLLDTYRPYDAEEEDYVGRMLTLCNGLGDPFARDHFVPGHFTASAFILSPDEQSLLLIFHEKLKRWLQPGGHIDPADANVVDAALREVHEEVGIGDLTLATAGIFDVDIHAIPPRNEEPAHDHFDVRFLFRANDLNAVAASDALAVRWLHMGEINNEISDRSVMRAVEKLKAR